MAFDIHFENGVMVDKTVDGGQRHCMTRKDLVPFAAWLVGGKQQGTSFVTGADQLEQDTGLGPIYLVKSQSPAVLAAFLS